MLTDVIENNDFTLPKSSECSIKTFQERDNETGDMIFFSSGESMLEGTNLLINDDVLRENEQKHGFIDIR